jgi:hypothetical protein
LPAVEPEDAAQLRDSLDALSLNQTNLAQLMTELGDAREMKTILRSIQRMAGREAKLSGEMQVILTLLKREQSRARRVAEAADWIEQDGRLTAVIQGVRVTLAPQTRGRWSIHARHIAERPDGYSPEIPHWRNSLADAKLRAVLAVEETLDDLEMIAAQLAEDAA